MQPIFSRGTIYENTLNHRAQATRGRHPGERGFTLIELLVVIAVLAILAAIVIFNVTSVNKHAETSQCDVDKHTVQVASDTYFANNKTYATSDGHPGAPGAPAALVEGSLEPAYVHTWPGEAAWAIDQNGTLTNSCQ